MMKIEWDQENNIIRVGDAVFSSYRRFANSASWANKVLEANNKNIRLNEYAKNQKEANKQASEALGCSRAVLYKHFNALQLKVFVAPVYDILKNVGFSRRGFNTECLRKIHKHKDILEEVYNDKLYNILPIVCETGKSPKELKQEMKQAWKSISKNSLNKNKALVKACKGYETERLVELHDLPTTVLKNFFSCRPEVQRYIATHFKGKWNKVGNLNGDIRLFGDACYLADQLGESVDWKWTPRRVKEEHDRMSKEITAKKYSKDVFKSVEDISCKALKSGDYTAILLDNAFAIADEGNNMGHCVVGYSDSVRDGKYLVYSVTKNSERSSTIGIYLRDSYKYINNNTGASKLEEPIWMLQQQYGRYNALVVDEEERQLAQILVGMLNKKLDKPEFYLHNNVT